MTLSIGDRTQAGIARWRTVGDAITEEIRAGRFGPGGKLPAELDLAERYGVARQTVRRAIQQLQSDGIVRSEHGRGTFVTERVFEYRISARRTFEENLVSSSLVPARRLLRMERRHADATSAAALVVAPGDAVLYVETLGLADELPLNIARVEFPAARMPGLGAAIERLGRTPRDFSISGALAAIGVAGYRRASIRLEVHRATAEERTLLGLTDPAMVVRTESASVDRDGLPVFRSSVSYDPDKVSFYVGEDAFAPSAASGDPPED